MLVDFGDMDSMPEVIEEVLECYRCVDILIINSSLKVKAPAQSVTLEMEKLIMDNNYFGPITLAKGKPRNNIEKQMDIFEIVDRLILMLMFLLNLWVVHVLKYCTQIEMSRYLDYYYNLLLLTH